MNSYSEPENAHDYASFMESEEGKTQQRLVWEAVAPRVQGAKILDAACGTGWFAGKLAERSAHVAGCDASESLIAQARAAHPNVHFDVADLAAENLPHTPKEFSTIVLNMALHDFPSMEAVLKNLHGLLQPNGTLLVTVANPYYSFPVGVWKRGLLGKISRSKPVLKLRDYGALVRSQSRAFTWHSGNTSYFYTLPEMLNVATACSFTLAHAQDVLDASDSKKFGKQYKMHRFPLIILLEFRKAA